MDDLYRQLDSILHHRERARYHARQAGLGYAAAKITMRLAAIAVISAVVIVLIKLI